MGLLIYASQPAAVPSKLTLLLPQKCSWVKIQYVSRNYDCDYILYSRRVVHGPLRGTRAHMTDRISNGQYVRFPVS